MSSDDKFEWAMAKRARGNELFAQRKFVEAGDVYVQALLGLDFQGTPEQSERSRTQIQVPVCNNLAAIKVMKKASLCLVEGQRDDMGGCRWCCRVGTWLTVDVWRQEWSAALALCNQVLRIDKHSFRAYIRRARVYRELDRLQSAAYVALSSSCSARTG